MVRAASLGWFSYVAGSISKKVIAQVAYLRK